MYAMTPAQLRQLLKKSGLSQVEAARLIDVTDRTMRRYLSGEIKPIPRVVELALLYAIHQPGSEAFYRAVGASVRERAGCTCGGFEIVTYPGVSPGPASLAGFKPGHCKACTSGTTEDTAYQVLKINRIPVIQPQRKAR
jgi:transcriptional regulator with XRE-family HTH domain